MLRLLLCFGLLLTGCAETRMVMTLSPEGSLSATPIVWPASPEVPRYRYIGELTGESNFRPEVESNQSASKKLFSWLVGLTEAHRTPVVLQRPQGGVVDEEGRVYVTDVSRGAVFVFDQPAGRLDVLEMAQVGSRFLTPVGIVLGKGGEILVSDADLHGVFRLDKKGSPLGEFGVDVLKRPTGLARDAQRGIVYVSDTYSHDIKAFSDEGKLLKTIGQRGEGDGELNFPTHLFFANNQLYVTDTLNSRVQVFDADGKVVKKIGQRGLQVGNLVRPKGVAVDSNGNTYVIESLYDHMLVFNNHGDLLLAVGGNGKEQGHFYLPAGIWVDNKDYIYIADMFNGRITILQFLGGS